MPTVARIGNLAILFFYNDHGAPHFHVVGPDFTAKILMADFSLLSCTGKIRNADLRVIQDWGQKHRDSLLLNWHRARADEPLEKIED